MNNTISIVECPLCKGKMEWKKHPFSLVGTELGKFEAEVCTKCGEAWFTEEASDQIDERAKELGLWGIGKRENNL